jgi:hypothetical protein
MTRGSSALASADELGCCHDMAVERSLDVAPNSARAKIELGVEGMKAKK